MEDRIVPAIQDRSRSPAKAGDRTGVSSPSSNPLPLGSHPGRSGGRFPIFLLTLFFATPAIASTLNEGIFVRADRACASAADTDRLLSNGHSVSPPGQNCRVVSRQSSGGYYPIFNQRCTGGAGEDLLTDLIVSAPDRIAVRRRADGATIAYRYCPPRIAAPDAH